MTYSAAQAARDAAVNDERPPLTVVDAHAAACDWRQQERPAVWRSKWDWYPPESDDPDEWVYDQFIPREAPRLLALYAEHDRTCPQARDPLDDARVAYGMSPERTQCPYTADLRLCLAGYGIDRMGCTRPQPQTGAAGVEVLAEMDVPPPAPLALGRLSLSHTVLYGDGEMGKGTLASKWIADATREGHTVLVLDYEAHPDEWGYRIRMLGGDTALVRYASPNTAGWAGAIWDHVEDIIEAAEDACLIVVDSISQACVGSDPKDDETATRYAAAIQQTARPVLSLAHVTKSGESRWPYGSVYWHNLARVTWHLSKVPGGRLLKCRKANAHRKPPPQLVTLAEYHDRFDLSEQAQQESLLDRALDILEAEALPLKDIVARINEDADEDDEHVKPQSVTKALQRGRRDKLLSLENGLWSRT